MPIPLPLGALHRVGRVVLMSGSATELRTAGASFEEMRVSGRVHADADAAGWVLLADRESWRSSPRRVELALALDDEAAASIVERGYGRTVGGGVACRCLAVAVPADAPPIAAFAVRG